MTRGACTQEAGSVLYLSKVAAGFPSPADDYIANKLDLNEYLIKHPSATFLVRATGEAMLDAGIRENDILVVDRSLTPHRGAIVVAAVDGQLTVKRLEKNVNGNYILHADNKVIEMTESSDSYIWGVVSYIIHSAL